MTTLRATDNGLTDRHLTYSPVGATRPGQRRWGEPPAGFRALETTVYLGVGVSCWVSTSTAVLHWAVKTRSGFTVGGPAHGIRVGDRCWLRAGLGPVTISEPVQVVGLVDTPTRRGFAYGTLAGHPICGEEAFVVHRDEAGQVWLTLRSLTRASPHGPWRQLFPVLLVAQRVYRRRYEKALVCPDPALAAGN